MQKKFFVAATMAVISSASGLASAKDVLTGDARLACETVLCLASGTRPSECTPALNRFFSISARKLKDTLTKRRNFLQLCPSSNQTPEMAALISAQANGAGRCDAESLNSTLISLKTYGGTYINNKMPDYCTIYTGHAYTDLELPRYVGTPENGGRWVNASDYERAKAEYDAKWLRR